jgi:CSLREA domain-containing protein
MTAKKISILLGCLLTLLIFSTACTPEPNCAVSDYYVTKTDDTSDGVCSAGDCSLREAVQNANACPGTQTIHIPAGGYHLTRTGADEDAGETGDLDITDDVNLIGYEAPSIHGDGDRSFHIHSPAVVNMEMIWLADGEAILGAGLLNESQLTLDGFTCNFNTAAMPPGGMGDARGGCIFNAGDLTIDGGYFLENSARQGGAIYLFDGASLIMSGGYFIGNQADDHGGGMWISPSASAEIDDFEIRENSAGLNGGGVWNNGSATLTSVVFEDNEASGDGGGTYTWDEGSTIHYSTWYKDNTASQGGAIYNSGGMVHLYQSSATGNVASGGTGGGFYNAGSLGGLLLRNTTVSGNTAVGGSGGGGIYSTGNLQFEFITVAGNDSEGIRIDSAGEVKIRSSILAGNTGGNCTGLPLDSQGYNVDDGNSCVFSSLDDLSNTDPLLEPAAMNGGNGLSHALDPASPAIDSGDPDRCTAEDQRGVSRPQGSACDRGALEMEIGLGSISGWTYIDDNENGLRDTGEGWVSGAILTLKEGVCPGMNDVETVNSDSTGYYELTDVPPGTYCLAKSPLQETFDPESYDLVLEPGLHLEEINFRFQGLPLTAGTISGIVWHDLCAVPEESTTTVPSGCIELPSGGLEADGIYDPAEPGIENIQVRLGVGTCPGSEMATTLTDVSGNYTFSGVYPGVYCVSISALDPPNDSILIPGGWTYPERGAELAVSEVLLAAGAAEEDIHFGWDYQFLPAPSAGTLKGEFAEAGRCRQGPGTEYETTTTFEAGRIVEILARSDPTRPLWWYVRDPQLDILCWVSDLILKTEADPELVEVETAPLLPTETPLVCSADLPKNLCEKAGGEWFTPTSYVGDPYCKCPED